MTGFHSCSFFVVGAFLLSGCNVAISTSGTSSPRSKIIEQVEAAGSGPVEKVSAESLYLWFRDRIPLTLAINKQCKEIRPRAPAGWGDTAEGRVCEITRQISALKGQ